MIHALVFVKSLAAAKSRLADGLAPEARRALVLAMMEDVCRAAASTPNIADVWVVTPDSAVARHAEEIGAGVLQERDESDLNDAVRFAQEEARARGWEQLLILPGDLPLMRADDLRAMAKALRASPHAVIAPAWDGRGTNALLIAPPDLLRPSYGADSFALHKYQLAPVAPVIVRRDGLARDIDAPADLDLLAAAKASDPRYAASIARAREDA